MLGGRLQGLEVHPLSERLPPGCRTRTGALTRSEVAVLARGFVALQLLQRGVGVTRRGRVEDAQRGVPSAQGSSSSAVAPLELLDDGGKLGVQGRPAGSGAGRRPGSAVLLLLVRRRRRRRSARGRRRRPGGTCGRGIRLAARWRGRGSALLAAAGCRGADGARVRGGGLALGQKALLHHQRTRPVEQRGPVSRLRFPLAPDEEAAVRLLYFVVDDVRDALQPAGRVYTCAGSHGEEKQKSSLGRNRC